MMQDVSVRWSVDISTHSTTGQFSVTAAATKHVTSACFELDKTKNLAAQRTTTTTTECINTFALKSAQMDAPSSTPKDTRRDDRGGKLSHYALRSANSNLIMCHPYNKTECILTLVIMMLWTASKERVFSRQVSTKYVCLLRNAFCSLGTLGCDALCTHDSHSLTFSHSSRYALEGLLENKLQQVANERPGIFGLVRCISVFSGLSPCSLSCLFRAEKALSTEDWGPAWLSRTARCHRTRSLSGASKKYCCLSAREGAALSVVITELARFFLHTGVRRGVHVVEPPPPSNLNWKHAQQVFWNIIVYLYSS